MFKEAVERFTQYENVYAAMYADGVQTIARIMYKPDTKMEVRGGIFGTPYFMLFTPTGVFLDHEMQTRHLSSSEDNPSLGFLLDPRVIAKGVIPESEREEVGELWIAEYDIRNLGLNPEDMLHIRQVSTGFKRSFEFTTLDGLLGQMTHQGISLEHQDISLIFNYHSSTDLD